MFYSTQRVPSICLLTVFAVCLAMGACASGEGSHDFKVSVASIPPGQINLDGFQPSGMLDTILLEGDTALPNGRESKPFLVASFQIDFSGSTADANGSGPTVKLLQQLEVSKDTRAQCLLADGGILIPEGRLNKHPTLWSMKDGTREDVTPKNYSDIFIPAGQANVGILGCDTASNIFISAAFNRKDIALWTGKTRLKKVDNRPDNSWYGSYWGDDGIRYLLVTTDYRLAAIDGEKAAVVEQPDMAWVQSALLDANSKRQREMRDIVVVDNLCCARFKDEIEFYSKSGGNYSIRLISTVEETPYGLPRREADAQRILDEPHFLVGEGAKLPPDVAALSKTYCMPLDPQRIAVVDTDYYRVIIVQAAPPK